VVKHGHGHHTNRSPRHFVTNVTLFALAVLLACTGLDPLAAGQDTATTLSVDVKVVTLPVTVRDKRGQIVRDLTKDDFTLEQDGRPQTIRYFSLEKDLPLTLGLLVDTSLSQRNVLDQERSASRSFLDEMLSGNKDKAFLIHFDREVELLQDLTSSKEKLQSALDLLKTPDYERETSGGSGNPQDSRHGSHGMRGGGTQLYDAVYLAANELMKKQQGRKAIIILSDGVDRGSKESLESAIEAAQRADTIVYSILFVDTERGEYGGRDHSHGGVGVGWPGGGGGWPGGGGNWPGGGRSGGGRSGGGGPQGGPRPTDEVRVDGKKILDRISKETGGRLYEVSKKEPIDQIYSSIAEELRTQYSMGYTPDKESASAGYHKITLEARRKDLSVVTRDGYYAD